jgi:asparagine synthase (glutamine-hydrolysing)
MCGIFGYIGDSPLVAQAIHSMSEVLRHRGPDDEGFLVFRGGTAIALSGADTPSSVLEDRGNRGVPRGTLRPGEPFDAQCWAIGHRRLSIVDLSAAGHQPMSGDGGRSWIAFNGEVYNFVELRQELEAIGARFSTGTDTEVLLAAYARWGTDCFGRLRGMWALAIVDITSGELVLARDPYGIKPLYLCSGDGWMAFASEIKAFTVLNGWFAKARLDGIADFLVYEQSDHREESLFEGVRQLPPGCLMRLPLRGDPARQAESRPERWYNLTEAVASRGVTDADIRSIVDESVRLHLRADVPVGSCLSGGIDSSSIVALAAQRIRDLGSSRSLMTITASAEDSRIDETRYAAMAAEAAGAIPNIVAPSADKLLADLDDLVWHQDEPFVSSSIFVQWCVFGKAKELGLTVMLDGQGADEAFGGYRGFIGAFLVEELHHGGMRNWIRRMYEVRSGTALPIHRLLGYTVAYSSPRLRRLLGLMDGRSFAQRTWLSPGFRSIAASRPDPRRAGNWSSVASMSMDMVERSNLPMLLRWEDRNSMAFSIEARVPFVDRQVIEAAIATPAIAKLGRGVQKQVLRSAMRGVVPDAILDRKDKLGFLSSEELWMTRTHRWQFRALLQQAVEGLPGIVSPSILRDFDAVCEGRKRFDYRFWRSICLDRWRRRFSVNIPTPTRHPRP